MFQVRQFVGGREQLGRPADGKRGSDQRNKIVKLKNGNLFFSNIVTEIYFSPTLCSRNGIGG
jgi:hypothetical protein